MTTQDMDNVHTTALLASLYRRDAFSIDQVLDATYGLATLLRF